MTKDSKYLFERTKRTWDEVDLCSVNSLYNGGEEMNSEVDKPYRDPSFCCFFLILGKILIASLDMGGYFEHYDGNGKLKNVMTSGEWVAGQIASIDTLGRTVISIWIW